MAMSATIKKDSKKLASKNQLSTSNKLIEWPLRIGKTCQIHKNKNITNRLLINTLSNKLPKRKGKQESNNTIKKLRNLDNKLKNRSKKF
jgi:hypothetical protein